MASARQCIIAILSVVASIALVREKYIPKTTEVWDEESDIIIVGAGTAGCVLANRLTEGNCFKSVLVLEAGTCPYAPTEVPIAVIGVYNSENDWRFQSEKLTGTGFGCGLKDEVMPISRGKALGGSSTLNFMVYQRGCPSDYDQWEKNGAEGWSYSNMLKYFLRAENNTNQEFLKSDQHSANGTITVENMRDCSDVMHAFNNGCMEMGLDYEDCNDGRNKPRVVKVQGTTRNARRCSTAKAYCVPADCRENLKIVKLAHVTKILFNGTTAIGVMFKKDGVEHCVKAKKEVILAAGAISTPKLLQLSGIGPKYLLDKLNISIIADRPVGENYQDHLGTPCLCFQADKAVPLLPNRLFDPKSAVQYLIFKNGAYTSLSGVEGVAFINTKYANTSGSECPDGVIYMAGASVCSDFGFYLANVTGMSREFYEKFCRGYELKRTFCFFVYNARPSSRGKVYINSTDPCEKPIIKPPLPNDKDLNILVETLKFCLALLKTEAFKKIEAKLFDNPFLNCTNSTVTSDKCLEDLVKCSLNSYFHPAGTCKMGAENDSTAVVNSKLLVKGMSNLRIVDASIMPIITSCDTSTPTVAIAEKAADEIKKLYNCSNQSM